MVTRTQGNPPTVTVQVRYFASARSAAGVETEAVELPQGSSIAELITELRARHSEQLARVLTIASYLLDGVAARDTSVTMNYETHHVDVLPPFAGG